MWSLKNFILLVCLCPYLQLTAQSNIPVDSWRVHISYNNINSIATSNTKIYGASWNSILILDRSENSITTWSKINGLTGGTISFINYDNVTNQLLIAYTDGDLDIIKENTVTNFSRLKDSSFPGSKKINHISFRNGDAYLSADYGMVVFSMTGREVKETWRDLGPNGESISITQSTFKGDSIFLATSKGVLGGDLDNNLLDFNHWKRFDQSEFDGPIQGITFFNDLIYATINNEGLFHYNNGIWIKESILQYASFESLTSSAASLVISEDNHVWKLSQANILTEVSSDLITAPNFAIEDEQGIISIGDHLNGLVSNEAGSFTRYIPNGPAFQKATRLKYLDGKIYAMQGGHTTTFQPAINTGIVSFFSSGNWLHETSPANDITDIDFINGSTATSSFGFGVPVGNIASPHVIYNDSNSTLINATTGENNVNITAVESSGDYLWVGNYGVASPLHLFKDNTWQAFDFSFAAARFPLDLLVDYTGGVWATLSSSSGGGLLVFNAEENKTAYLTNQNGSGGLPSRNVNAFAQDRDGYVWVGTDRGVAYFFNPREVFSTNVNAVLPIFDNQYLLSDEKITAIAVDGGNRKWIGTERGVWLFNATGDELIHSFTEENSPLLSNVIISIAIDPVSGEVFFSTEKGIVSFRSDATESELSFQSVKIFPNPVTPSFNGLVGISGLATDAIVKITDVNGKLIWQSYANGGTATWNVRDYNGKRPSTGMYLIFSATKDGNESFVGKIAVIE